MSSNTIHRWFKVSRCLEDQERDVRVGVVVRVGIGGTAAVVSGAVVIALSWRQYLDQNGTTLGWTYLAVGAGALVGEVVRHDDLLCW